ncbi:MAG: transposase [Rhodanobacter sp.]
MRPTYYPEELKAEAIKLVVERRLPATEVASRLNVRTDAVRVWVRRFRFSRRPLPDAEVYRLKVELHEAAVERDVLVSLAAKLLAKFG